MLLSVLDYREEVFEVCIVDDITRQETVIMECENSEAEGHKVRKPKDQGWLDGRTGKDYNPKYADDPEYREYYGKGICQLEEVQNVADPRFIQ